MKNRSNISNNKPIYHFIHRGKRRKAKDVAPAYKGEQYYPEDDLIGFSMYSEELRKMVDGVCFRCDIREYNPDIDKVCSVSFQTLMLGLLSKEE